ncbi:50S ribosomal protein L21 [Candidatus Epulonipiscium fishelsonii]|uniref:50S ribosomal protein L21 n=1 Tax=Candidatus Epulonipiscium fishelsonii TaxID=77094 RepID=A0ACC8X9W9_9FIRM|nr:50S ribosomal protein L21 [Epulopiscium sp. SCG-B11WGA-EpuloA1]ONI41725.1 50S ribosomal protein L21 [Epulopiscium sp. SCG-B05WGA-EpuloA1]
MYAIIETGGKQYKVEEGNIINIEKLDMAVGETVNFDQILAVSTDKGMNIGNPTVKGAKIKGEVLAQFKGKKIIVFKYKRKKSYKKKQGHRQLYTKVKITSITA